MTTPRDFVDKYARMLGVSPSAVLLTWKDNLGARALGKARWSTSAPQQVVFELQRAIASDARTLERIIAHEMVHAALFLSMTPAEIAQAKLHNWPFRLQFRNGHGPAFVELAARVNVVMGKDFVTVGSDQTYALRATSKPYYVLVRPAYGDRLGWAWAARLSPDASAEVGRQLESGRGRLALTTDPQWADGRARIKRNGGVALPKEGSEREHALRALYASATVRKA